jgi:hypothetical protein
MSRLQAPQRSSAMWPKAWISSALGLAACTLIPWVAMALQPEDIEALESPLLLSVAHQIESGPRELYGPYDSRNPLVLIHAPLYYRLAGAMGWLFFRAGSPPITAALAAGRLLSALGFLATLMAAYRLARLGDMPARAGGWAVLLVAATPIYGGIPLEVRPDMLGIALQTTGIFLVHAALATAPVREAKLNAAAACFAVAVCIKQQYLVAPLVSLVLMAGARARGRLGSAAIVRFVAISSCLTLFYYGAEEWVTSGRMSKSVFIAARNVSRVRPADWPFAGNLLLAVIWKCVGPILLLAAAGLAMVSARNRPARRAFVIVGTSVIGVVVALAALQFFIVRIGISAMLVAGLVAMIVAVIPACVLLEKSLVGNWLDRALWLYFAAELALTTILWRLSTGGWFNYAIPAVVIGCTLTGRALARGCNNAPSWRPLLPAVLAAMAVPLFAVTDLNQVRSRRADEKLATSRLLEQIPRASTELFFVDLPGANRLHGRIDLVYDHWLYPVFESTGLAEPRSIWLERALATGPVRVVATTSSRAQIDGLTRSLPDLGYSLFQRTGPYYVWARRAVATR